MEINETGQLSSSEAFYNPNAVTVYKKIVDGTATYPAIKTVDLEYKLYELENSSKRINQLQSKVNKIIDNLTEEYWFNPNTEASTILEDLCDILEYVPKKTIQFSGTIEFSGSIDIDLSEAEDFDLHYFLGDELSLDTNNGDLVIDTWEIGSAQESY